MRRFRFLGLGAILLVLWWLVAPPGSGARDDGVDRVEVTNFPATQTVDGRVRVTEPVPQTRLASSREIVGPVDRHEVERLVDGGTLEAEGFGSATLSLGGFAKGNLSEAGAVGAILIPEVEEVSRLRLEEGRLQFPIRITADVDSGRNPAFEAQSAPRPLAFPRYRILYFNEGQRSVEVTLYAYLGNR